MPKEYKTIQEVAGPLMLVHGVENVTYDELGEIVHHADAFSRGPDRKWRQPSSAP